MENKIGDAIPPRPTYLLGDKYKVPAEQLTDGVVTLRRWKIENAPDSSPNIPGATLEAIHNARGSCEAVVVAKLMKHMRYKVGQRYGPITPLISSRQIHPNKIVCVNLMAIRRKVRCFANRWARYDHCLLNAGLDTV